MPKHIAGQIQIRLEHDSFSTYQHIMTINFTCKNNKGTYAGVCLSVCKCVCDVNFLTIILIILIFVFFLLFVCLFFSYIFFSL